MVDAAGRLRCKRDDNLRDVLLNGACDIYIEYKGWRCVIFSKRTRSNNNPRGL
jgi:hypothetical protein